MASVVLSGCSLLLYEVVQIRPDIYRLSQTPAKPHIVDGVQQTQYRQQTVGSPQAASCTAMSPHAASQLTSMNDSVASRLKRHRALLLLSSALASLF
jgi:hypothetical protein